MVRNGGRENNEKLDTAGDKKKMVKESLSRKVDSLQVRNSWVAVIASYLVTSKAVQEFMDKCRNLLLLYIHSLTQQRILLTLRNRETKNNYDRKRRLIKVSTKRMLIIKFNRVTVGNYKLK